MTSPQCNLCLPGLSDSPASRVAGITGTHLFSRDGFQHVGQAGLELLTLGNLPTSASQSAVITGVSHYAWPIIAILMGVNWYLIVVLIYIVLMINYVEHLFYFVLF